MSDLQPIPAAPGTAVSRRDFLAVSAGSLALTVVDSCCQSAAADKLGAHHIPIDKNLDKAWVDSLFAKGQTKVAFVQASSTSAATARSPNGTSSTTTTSPATARIAIGLTRPRHRLSKDSPCG